MSIVVDCSVAMAWYLPDESNPAADRVLSHTAANGAVVPFLFKVEFANALLMAERRNRISADYRQSALDELGNLQLVHDLEGHGNVWSTLSELARRQGLTVYDAAYLELAQRLRLPLATFDNALRVAAGQTGVEVFSDGA